MAEVRFWHNSDIPIRALGNGLWASDQLSDVGSGLTNPISSIAQVESSGTTSAKAAGIGALRLAGFENLIL
jgi:hypothetical protein